MDGMRRSLACLITVSALLVLIFPPAPAVAQIPGWVDLFNGKNLDGWVDVNTTPETWSVKDGLLVCKTSSCKSNGGTWKPAATRACSPGATRNHVATGCRTGSKCKCLKTTGTKSTAAPTPTSVASCTIKLAINGKFVNGISKSTRKKGYLCLESEGAEIHFRNIRIMELETGYAKPEEIAPRAADDQVAAPKPAFEMQKIDDIKVGYGLAIGDVDGDGKDDILLADAKEIAWYKNPGWEKTVIAKDLTARDNVCIAARDLDGDGKVEVAVGAMWNPGETTDTTKSGSIHYLIRPADGKGLWKDVRLPHEPTTHRMRWAKGVPGSAGFSLVVLPLHGRGNVRGTGEPVKVICYAFPGPDLIKDPEAWHKVRIANELHSTHNFDLAGPQETVVIGGFEGVNVGGKPILTKVNGCRGVGEVRAFKNNGFVTIEPMHGTDLVTYKVNKNGIGWTRTVLTDQLKAGHALAVGDVLGTGSECIAVGWRSKNKAGKFGLKLFVPGEDAWTEHWIDDSIAVEDLKLADLDGDGKLDIVAAGRSTGDVKIFWNRSK